jgi:hypothetical protein
MSTYTPDGYQLEGPVVMSNGEFKLRENMSGYKGCPLADYGTADSDDHNKRWCSNYGDTNGVSGVIGFPMENKYASGSADVERVGMGGRRRDIAMFHAGGIESPYQGTTNPLPALRPIAPHPRGFQEWAPGMFLMGHTLTYAWTGEADCKIYVNCLSAPQFKYKTEEINFSPSLTLPVASGLSFTPKEILSLTISGSALNVLSAQSINVFYSGIKGYAAVVSGSAMWTPGTKKFAIHADHVSTTGFVDYKYWDGV